MFAASIPEVDSGSMVVNSEADTLVDSELGTMVINEDADDDDSTMKREYTSRFFIIIIVHCQGCCASVSVGLHPQRFLVCALQSSICGKYDMHIQFINL